MTRLMPLLILGIPVMDILQVVPVRIKKKLPLPRTVSGVSGGMESDLGVDSEGDPRPNDNPCP